MSFRFHGNYCGPGWSDGKYQPSVVGKVTPLDKLDASCQKHDAAYALGGNRSDADLEFSQETFGQGIKSTLASVIVGVQGGVRYMLPRPDVMMTKKNGNLRGSKPSTSAMVAAKPKKDGGGSGVKVQTAPVSIGTTLRSIKPRITATGGVVTIVGREFIASLPELNSTSWTLGALYPIHPAYFPSTVLGNQTRSYQKWRCNKFNVHFITRQPTSSSGELLMSVDLDVNNTEVNYNASDFMARALSLENAVIGPLWVNHSISVGGDNVWRDIDAFSNPDINDNIFGELQVFVQAGVTDTAGFLVLDYDFSFSKPMYTMHSTVLPLPSASISRGICIDSADQVAAARFMVLPPSGVSFVSGAVYKFVLDSTRSLYADALDATNTLQINTNSNYTNKTVADGHTFYGIASTTSLVVLFPSMSSALDLSTNVSMVYRNTAAGAVKKAQWYFTYYLVQYGLANMIGVS